MMSHETSADLAPDRDRVANAIAAVPIIDIAPFVHGDPTSAGAHWRGKILAARQISTKTRWGYSDIPWR
jgi:hypothetical protein